MSEKLNPVTREEMFLAKAAGQDTPELKPITRVERFLQNLIDHVKTIGTGGSGGGGATPDWNAAEGEPGHILNRPFGDMEVYILPKTEVTFAPQEELGGMNAAIVEFAVIPVPGGEYTVEFGGAEYTCTYTDASGDGSTCVMGNLAALGAGDDTGEPFAVYVEDGLVLIIPTGEVTTTEFCIRGVQPVPIAPEYAPESVLLDFVEIGLPSVNTEQAVSAEFSDLNTWNKLKTAFGKGIVKVRFTLTAGITMWHATGVTDQIENEEVIATANVWWADGRSPCISVFLGDLYIYFEVSDVSGVTAFAKRIL